jgi:sialate O-acetylesterase
VRRVGVVGGKVKGVLWYQGESDAGAKAAPLFREKFERLVAAMRQDFGQPDLPFYYVQIGRFIIKGGETYWEQVQEMQRQAEQSIPHTGMAAAVDFELDDLIHVGTQDHKRLGQRLAKMAIRDLFPGVKNFGPYKNGPRPVSATLQKGEVIRVTFSGVNGRLRHEGRLAGFTIHDAKGEPLSLIYKAVVDPADSSAVLLYFWSKLPEGATLYYGYGKDPYCNLRDDADMAAPVFGPLPIR